jgi:glutamate N-acetyltransferase/amino-acid N-acetyltransferase
MIAPPSHTLDKHYPTVSKQFRVNGKTVAISGIAKGSGMIRPNMATMLSFIFTDVKATQSELQDCLTTATKINDHLPISLKVWQYYL